MKSFEKNKNSSLLLVVLLIGAGLFVYLALNEPSGSLELSSHLRATSEQVNERSNSHLFLTAKRIELEQERRRLENLQQASEPATETIEGERYNENYGVQHTGDRNELNSYEDLRRYDHRLEATSPSYQVQSSLFEKQKLAEYSEEYKREYARQFLANARAAGYDVTLSNDFVVVSVKRIHQGQSRTIQSVDEAQPKKSSDGQAHRFIPL